jgi:UDP-2,4-diacetamido-2,4,6-trideoxy-beta-L-altropyranose hydrolase
VAVGSRAPSLAELQRIESEARNISVQANSTSMAELMVAADLAIGSGGSTTWERCCLGLTGLYAIGADNQAHIVSGIVGRSAGVSLGRAHDLTAELVRIALTRFCSDPDLTARMAENASSICDGGGVGRVVGAILAPGSDC